ncbi:MAG: GTP-binding protein [Saprospiraceae bacterium]|nr:GTP-binding protein [Saprospiraceae bacterium]
MFQQFIHSKFDERYLTTIGVKVNKKTVNVSGATVEIFLWDVAGEVSQDKVPVSYFLGAHGIIYVFDLTRPLTYQNMASDISYLKKLAPKATVKIVGNKKDLVTQEQLNQVINTLDVPHNIATSAKTGENVLDLFENLASEMFQKLSK